MVWRTMIITVTTCFLLGTTFTHWIADHNVLWRSPLTAEAVMDSITYYSLLSAAPPGLGWVYILVGLGAIVSTGGRLVKGWRGANGEVLFDGGSVVLLSGITYYQMFEVFPTISLFPYPLPPNITAHPTYPALATAVRDLALDNVMTAVMLTGVMLLQGGRYYAKRPSSSDPKLLLKTDDAAPSSVSVADAPPSPIAARASTPYRELTEAEAMELNGLGKNSPSKRRQRKR